jgi:hypothetical protein
MTKIKQLKSNKLYYGKWPFKLECRIKGANKITNLGLEKARDWCLGNFDLKYNYPIIIGLLISDTAFASEICVPCLENKFPIDFSLES